MHLKSPIYHVPHALESAMYQCTFIHCMCDSMCRIVMFSIEMKIFLHMANLSMFAFLHNNSRPVKYPVIKSLCLPFPAPFMGVTWNSYITLLLVSLYSFLVKLNSEMLTTLVIEKVLKGAPASVMSTRYQISGSTPVMSKLNGASQVRRKFWQRNLLLRLVTASSRPAEDTYVQDRKWSCLSVK